MQLASCQPLFAWDALEDSPSLGTIKRVLASIPDGDRRATFVRSIQQVLKRSRCYDGALTGRSEDAQEGLHAFVANAKQRGVRALGAKRMVNYLPLPRWPDSMCSLLWIRTSSINRISLGVNSHS